MSLETQAIRGVTQNFGKRTTTKQYGGKYSYDGPVQTIEYVFNYNELPTYGTTNQNLQIPANAKILRAYFEVLTAFTSTSTTTDLDIGLYQADGTVIDANGIFTATALTQTVIGTANSFTAGDGALIGATIGAAAGEVTVAPTAADLLTGKARLLIEYVQVGV